MEIPGLPPGFGERLDAVERQPFRLRRPVSERIGSLSRRAFGGPETAFQGLLASQGGLTAAALGAAMAVGVLIAMAASIRGGSGQGDEHGAFFQEESQRLEPRSASRPVPARGRFSESLDYLIRANWQPQAPAQAWAPNPTASRGEPEERAAEPRSRVAGKPARRRAAAPNAVFQSRSGLSNGIGKSFQPVLRQPIAEGAPGGQPQPGP